MLRYFLKIIISYHINKNTCNISEKILMYKILLFMKKYYSMYLSGLNRCFPQNIFFGDPTRNHSEPLSLGTVSFFHMSELILTWHKHFKIISPTASYIEAQTFFSSILKRVITRTLLHKTVIFGVLCH